MQTAEITDWFQSLVCVRWAFVTLCPPGTDAKSVLRFYVFLCCASLFSYYCPVLPLTGSLSGGQGAALTHLCALLNPAMLPQQASPPRDYDGKCLSAWWTLSSLVTHDYILCFWLRGDLDVENRMRNAMKIVSKFLQFCAWRGTRLSSVMMRLFPKEIYLILCSA